MRPRGSPEELERRRRRAIELLKQGQPPVEVARRLQVDRRSVRRWKATHAREGPAGLRARPTAGRPAKLNAHAKERLEERLFKGAKAAGFPSDLWTCPRVLQVIARQFGVHYHVDHIGRLLHGLGWSPQKPQRRAVERDEGKIRNWIKRDWPRIKKKPGD
jgi:transposase